MLIQADNQQATSKISMTSPFMATSTARAIVVHVVCATTKKRKAEKCSGTDGLTDG